MPAPAPRAPSHGALSALRQAALYGSLGVTTGLSLLLIEERRRRICICKQIIERGQIVSAYRRHLHNVAVANLRNEDPPELPFESPRPHPLSVSEIDKAYARATGQRRRARLIPEIEDEYNAEHVAALVGTRPLAEGPMSRDHTSTTGRRTRRSSKNRRPASSEQQAFPGYGYGFYTPGKGHPTDSRRAKPIYRLNREVQRHLEYQGRLEEEGEKSKENSRRFQHRQHSKSGSSVLPEIDHKRIIPLRWIRPRTPPIFCTLWRPSVRDDPPSRLPPNQMKERTVPTEHSRITTAPRTFNALDELRNPPSSSAANNRPHQMQTNSGENASSQLPAHPRVRRILYADSMGSALVELCVWYKAHHKLSSKRGTTTNQLWKRFLPDPLRKRFFPLPLGEEDTALKEIALQDLKNQDLGRVIDFFLEHIPANLAAKGTISTTCAPGVATVLLGLATEGLLTDSQLALISRLKQWKCMNPSIRKLARDSIPFLLQASREEEAFRLLTKATASHHLPFRVHSLDQFLNKALQGTPAERGKNKLLQDFLSFTEFEDLWKKRVELAVIQHLQSSRQMDAISLIPEAFGKSYNFDTFQSVEDFLHRAAQMPIQEQKASRILQEMITMTEFQDMWIDQILQRCQYLLEHVSDVKAARLFTHSITSGCVPPEQLSNVATNALVIAKQGAARGSLETARSMYEWCTSMNSPSLGLFGQELVKVYAIRKYYWPIIDLYEELKDTRHFLIEGSSFTRWTICRALAIHAPYSIAVQSIGNILALAKDVESSEFYYEQCSRPLCLLLRRCWQETRNLETVESLAEEITNLDQLEGISKERISRERLQIKTLAGERIPILSTLDWSVKEPATVGQMMVYLARQGQWDSLAKFLEDTHHRISHIPEFCDTVFNPILKEHLRTHDSYAAQEFVTNAIESYQVVPNQLTADLVLDALTKDSRVDSIIEWTQYLWAKGFHVRITERTVVRILRRFFLTHKPPHGFLAQLSSRLCSTDFTGSSRLWHVSTSRIRSATTHPTSLLSESLLPLMRASVASNLGRKRKLRQGQKEFEAESGNVLARDIDSWAEQNSGEDELSDLQQVANLSPSLNYAKEQMRWLADIDQLAKTSPSYSSGGGLEAELALDLVQGKDQEVVRKYTRLLDIGLLGSPVAMDQAVKAAIRASGGDTAAAMPILQKAERLGMDIHRAKAAIVLHQIASSDLSPREIHDAVIDCFRTGGQANFSPPYFLAVAAAHHLNRLGHRGASVTLLSDVYLSSWTKKGTVDIRFMSSFLFMYGGTGNLRGVQWVVHNVLSSNMRIDRYFIDILKMSRNTARKRLIAQSLLGDDKLQERLDTLYSVYAPWVDDCNSRIIQQWKIKQRIGNRIVEVLKRLRGRPTEVVRRLRTKRLVPGLKVLYERRKKRMLKLESDRRKRAGTLVRKYIRLRKITRRRKDTPRSKDTLRPEDTSDPGTLLEH